jgi:hypothetical protein
VKKLAIVLVLVVASCRTAAVAGPVPANAPGAATPRDAVVRFLKAAGNQDVQEMGLAWGTVDGPAMGDKESRDERETREQREIVQFCYLKHDSYQVLGEAPARNAERVLAVELKFKGLTRPTNFTVTRGPSNRWYVRAFDIEALRDICAKK